MPSDTYTLTISDVGVSTPATGSVVNASVAANAAIAFSKLATLTSGNILVGNSSNVPTSVAVTGDITVSNAGVTAIASGAVVDADVNASAAIAHSKLASMSSGNILVGNSSNVPTSVALTGDVTVSNTGVAAIASGAIVNADVNASAAIAHSKLASMSSGNILVGSSGSVPTSVAVTGDITISNTGVTTLRTSPTLVTPILGTPTSGTLTSCTGLPLTTGVTGTLPVANGGTGVSASAYGQTGSQTAGSSTLYTTTYEKLALTTSLDAAAQFDANSVNNRLRYTGSATRRFLVFASMDMLSSTNGAQFSIKIAKNDTVIDATQCNASVSIKGSGTGIAKLVSNWIIEFAQNNYVEIFVASVGSSETGTPQRMRLVATPVF